jgi:hypothetical protein
MTGNEIRSEISKVRFLSLEWRNRSQDLQNNKTNDALKAVREAQAATLLLCSLDLECTLDALYRSIPDDDC